MFGSYQQARVPSSRPVRERIEFVKLPRPIYEAMPFFLVGAGILFITLVLKRYAYAPTLFIWLVGIFCILAGIVILTIRMIYRIRSRAEDEYASEEEY